MVSITIEDLTRAYLNLRTERSLLSQKFKEEDAELEDRDAGSPKSISLLSADVLTRGKFSVLD